MGSKFWPKRRFAGHHCIILRKTLVAFEFTPNHKPQPNSILFLGGLGDGLATTSYVADIVTSLQPTQWSLFTLNLTSSYQSWGFGHLDRDTDEIAQCIAHIHAHKTAHFGSPGRLVLMGHSTGSQCVLHYLSQPNPHTRIPRFDRGLEHSHRPVVDGAIMQAPVSDREAIHLIMRDGFLGRSPAQLRETYDRLVALARAGVDGDGDGDGDEDGCDSMLPIHLTAQFGYPRNTPAVPDWVDKEGLLARWRAVTDRDAAEPIWDHERSGLIPGASHALSNDDQAEPRAFLVRRILSYLEDLEKRG